MDEERGGKTTLKDVGVGMILLGGFVLLLTAVFFLMSFVDPKHYSLFSGEVHIIFYTALGIAFLAIGTALARRGPKPQMRAEPEPRDPDIPL